MLKKTLRAVVPIVALVAVAACADATGPTSPDFGAAQDEAVVDDRNDQLPPSQTKRTKPLEQEREREK